MKRIEHDKSFEPSIGTEVGIRLDLPKATVSHVTGYNPAYDSWIVTVDFMTIQMNMPIFCASPETGWSERITR